MAAASQAFLLLAAVFTSMVAVAMSSRPNFGNWGNWKPPGAGAGGFNKTNCPFTHPNTTHTSNEITVGGPAHWQFGVNYIDWTVKNGPFFVNDTLVFKFDAPNATTHAHSVVLLPNLRAWMKCDVSKGKKLATPTQGGGEGFKYVLKKWQPYYFACGEKEGFHCNNGTMKFAVMPMMRRFH
nr:uncharacterized protein LOC109164666 [Ipomoea batatas]